MIARYSREEMAKIWEPENRFAQMLAVEIAVAETQAALKIIPSAAAQAIRKKGRFSVARIDELEKTTRHDVIAFVSSVAESVGEHGRYVHYGMTSSDVLDTATSLQVRQAGAVLNQSLDRLLKALRQKMQAHRESLCPGRTHGMHAEPTTFGMKMAGYVAEFGRHRARLEQALKQMAIGKLSGAVGTYSTQPAEVESGVCERLELTPETVATQVIPRDRHAELFFALAMVGAGLERLAVELRHLQRTEVGEVVEDFSPGQKGSSAMPHKKNPISAENLTGAARLLRSYLQAAMENIALWHERDISHSSVERVALPDAFILCDYAVDRMATLVERLFVDTQRMQSNLELSQGHLFSSHALLALVDGGLTREEAYKLVQSHAHRLKNGQSLFESLAADPQVTKLVKKDKLKEIFAGKTHRVAIQQLLKRLDRQLKNSKESP